jgi:hypothetical protein
VINPFVDWGTDRPPQHEYADSIIYEAHVKSLRRNGINGVDPSASLSIGTLCARAAGRRLSSARTRPSVPSRFNRRVGRKFAFDARSPGT